jgi:phospholipid/cholesterol/gamma-HCH transport system permease protein
MRLAFRGPDLNRGSAMQAGREATEHATLPEARQRVRVRPLRPVEKGLGGLGRTAENLLAHLGSIGQLVWQTIVYLFTGRIPLREVVRQMYWMGVSSVPIVLVTGILAGVVTSQQGGYQFTGSGAAVRAGSVVTSSVVLELGPIMTAVVLIGRVGARITAELGRCRCRSRSTRSTRWGATRCARWCRRASSPGSSWCPAWWRWPTPPAS